MVSESLQNWLREERCASDPFGKSSLCGNAESLHPSASLPGAWIQNPVQAQLSNKHTFILLANHKPRRAPRF
ncbi:UNVERIFIED_CONTAM: hypothetical protein FKN15_051473 [Acipenser sinensis]